MPYLSASALPVLRESAAQRGPGSVCEAVIVDDEGVDGGAAGDEEPARAVDDSASVHDSGRIEVPSLTGFAAGLAGTSGAKSS